MGKQAGVIGFIVGLIAGWVGVSFLTHLFYWLVIVVLLCWGLCR